MTEQEIISMIETAISADPDLAGFRVTGAKRIQGVVQSAKSQLAAAKLL